MHPRLQYPCIAAASRSNLISRGVCWWLGGLGPLPQRGLLCTAARVGPPHSAQTHTTAIVV